MLIKKKSDIARVLDHFGSIADWDAEGSKHYLVFEDRRRGGQWTFMKYAVGGRFSVHGRGEGYHDREETFFEERAAAEAFLWENRAACNAAIRKRSAGSSAAGT